MKVLITGSCGLIGSEAVEYYCQQGHEVFGFDNNMRRYFFGPGGDTGDMKKSHVSRFKNYHHQDLDIRNRAAVWTQLKEIRPDLIIHTAGQPSHDWAAKEPTTDFEVNAMGTLNLLEGTRQFAAEAVFLFMSTNKVYGDSPNFLPLDETSTRYEYRGDLRGKGISETLTIDQSLHSLFGASKASADLLCQEYGRYFGLKTVAFRGGCLTGSRHAGVPLHGFLNYLVRCAIRGESYTIIGYKGKQVRDQIHSSDVIQAMELYRANPRPGEVYNLGGGFENSASVLEIITYLKDNCGLELKTNYVETPRRGDHICYYSDLGKLKAHYPSFRLKMSLPKIVNEIVSALREKEKKAA